MSIISEIKTFLDCHNVEYQQTGDNLNFTKRTGRGYEIEVVQSDKFPIANKKLGIDGVKLSHFFEKSYDAEHNRNSFICWVKDYEWLDDRKREVLKSYFLHAAGKTKNRFYARDCVVGTVNSKEARNFESVNCFYGKRGASLNLGLYLKKTKFGMPAGTLVMIYTFGKNFFGRDNSIEVLRVGTLRFSQVIGGSSKLVKHFLRNYRTMKIGSSDVPVKKLKFYSDYDHNIGGSMDSLGFKFVSYSKGGFMNLWLETGIVKGREPAKHKMIMEKMRDGKLIAIPNAGVKTFELLVCNPPISETDSLYNW